MYHVYVDFADQGSPACHESDEKSQSKQFAKRLDNKLHEGL
jgi:hypothetical protein